MPLYLIWPDFAFLGGVLALAAIIAVTRSRPGLALIVTSTLALILGLANVAGLASEATLSGGVYLIARNLNAINTLRNITVSMASPLGLAAWALCLFDAAYTRRWGWFFAILGAVLVGDGLGLAADVAAGMSVSDAGLRGSPAFIIVILAVTGLSYARFVVNLIYGIRRAARPAAPMAPQAMPFAQPMPPGARISAMPAPGWPAYYPPTAGAPQAPAGSPPPPQPPPTQAPTQPEVRG